MTKPTDPKVDHKPRRSRTKVAALSSRTLSLGPTDVDPEEALRITDVDCVAVSDADILFPELPTAVKNLAPTNVFAKDATERNAQRRLMASALLGLRVQGYNYRQIGQMLKMTTSAVRTALVRARQAGRLNELRNILDNESAALAVDALNHHLRKRDKDVALDTLRGLGLFRTYTENKTLAGAGVEMPPLQVNIVNAPNSTATATAAPIEPMGVARQDATE